MGLIQKPKSRVIVPRSSGFVSLAGRKFMWQYAYEAAECAIGTERAFQDDVDGALRSSYTERMNTA